MAEITIDDTTAVKPVSTAQTTPVSLGGTFTPGVPAYLDSATATYKPASSTALATADVKGIIVCGGHDGTKGILLTSGLLDIGTTTPALTATNAIWLSGTSGKLELESDIGSGEYGTFIGVMVSATRLDVQIKASGVAHP